MGQRSGYVNLEHARVKIPHNLTWINEQTTKNYSMPKRAGNYISATAAGIPSVRPKTAATIVSL